MHFYLNPDAGSLERIYAPFDFGSQPIGRSAAFDSDDDGVNNHLSPCHVHNVVADMPVTGSVIP